MLYKGHFIGYNIYSGLKILASVILVKNEYCHDTCCEGTEQVEKGLRPDLWTCRLIPA